LSEGGRVRVDRVSVSSLAEDIWARAVSAPGSTPNSIRVLMISEVVLIVAIVAESKALEGVQPSPSSAKVELEEAAT
jgi:hypothetical protein